jgi:DNA polymerase V
VILTEIIAAASRPRTLFDDIAAQQKSASLMDTLDRINRRMGSGTMQLLGEGVRKNWGMRRDSMSQHYTTEWNELAVAR